MYKEDNIKINVSDTKRYLMYSQAEKEYFDKAFKAAYAFFPEISDVDITTKAQIQKQTDLIAESFAFVMTDGFSTAVRKIVKEQLDAKIIELQTTIMQQVTSKIEEVKSTLSAGAGAV